MMVDWYPVFEWSAIALAIILAARAIMRKLRGPKCGGGKCGACSGCDLGRGEERVKQPSHR